MSKQKEQKSIQRITQNSFKVEQKKMEKRVYKMRNPLN